MKEKVFSDKRGKLSITAVPRRLFRVVLFAVLCSVILCINAVSTAGGSAEQTEEASGNHASTVPKTIIDMQPYREQSEIEFVTADGKRGKVSLINLNPRINAWYLLQIKWDDVSEQESYHLENPFPLTRRLFLDKNPPYGLLIEEGTSRLACHLWRPGAPDALRVARGSKITYAPLCDGRLYLRNPVKGYRTRLEMVTDFLRDEIRGGEQIVSLVKDNVFRHTFREKGKVLGESVPPASVKKAPRPALMKPEYFGRSVTPDNLGLHIRETNSKGLVLGSWYDLKDNSGIYVSLILPGAAAEEVLRSHPKLVNKLDNNEAESLVYLVAFDLEVFDLGFSLGTDHPRIGWSEHIIEQMRDRTLPGPDGIGSAVPLISTGLVSPSNALQTAATFTGGFKRSHGAFMYGRLASENLGSHYGFIENGVVFSRLQPGLSTLFVMDDGKIRMKTWQMSDNKNIERVKHARQNGVPILEFDEVGQRSVPGALVTQWGPGNWSGSADRKLRTLRSGAALQVDPAKRFLIYAVFTSATPSAMARVFQAYGCSYAMLLDMNALEHTYMAVYNRDKTSLHVQHLISGMNEVDRSVAGKYIPRFMAYADNRDFFYLMRRSQQEDKQ
ncbi:MAG: hypothetical protein ABII06_20365 [Pseudomonadota bacterium]